MGTSITEYKSRFYSEPKKSIKPNQGARLDYLKSNASDVCNYITQELSDIGHNIDVSPDNKWKVTYNGASLNFNNETSSDEFNTICPGESRVELNTIITSLISKFTPAKGDKNQAIFNASNLRTVEYMSTGRALAKLCGVYLYFNELQKVESSGIENKDVSILFPVPNTQSNIKNPILKSNEIRLSANLERENFNNGLPTLEQIFKNCIDKFRRILNTTNKEFKSFSYKEGENKYYLTPIEHIALQEGNEAILDDKEVLIFLYITRGKSINNIKCTDLNSYRKSLFIKSNRMRKELNTNVNTHELFSDGDNISSLKNVFIQEETSVELGALVNKLTTNKRFHYSTEELTQLITQNFIAYNDELAFNDNTGFDNFLGDLNLSLTYCSQEQVKDIVVPQILQIASNHYLSQKSILKTSFINEIKYKLTNKQWQQGNYIPNKINMNVSSLILELKNKIKEDDCTGTKIIAKNESGKFYYINDFNVPIVITNEGELFYNADDKKYYILGSNNELALANCEYQLANLSFVNIKNGVMARHHTIGLREFGADGINLTGTHKDILYDNEGIPFTGYCQSINKMFLDGKLLTGIAIQNGKYYEDGVPFTGFSSITELHYDNGILYKPGDFRIQEGKYQYMDGNYNWEFCTGVSNGYYYCEGNLINNEYIEQEYQNRLKNILDVEENNQKNKLESNRKQKDGVDIIYQNGNKSETYNIDLKFVVCYLKNYNQNSYTYISKNQFGVIKKIKITLENKNGVSKPIKNKFRCNFYIDNTFVGVYNIEEKNLPSGGNDYWLIPSNLKNNFIQRAYHDKNFIDSLPQGGQKIRYMQDIQSNKFKLSKTRMLMLYKVAKSNCNSMSSKNLKHTIENSTFIKYKYINDDIPVHKKGKLSETDNEMLKDKRFIMHFKDGITVSEIQKATADKFNGDAYNKNNVDLSTPDTVRTIIHDIQMSFNATFELNLQAKAKFDGKPENLSDTGLNEIDNDLIHDFYRNKRIPRSGTANYMTPALIYSSEFSNIEDQKDLALKALLIDSNKAIYILENLFLKYDKNSSAYKNNSEDQEIKNAGRAIIDIINADLCCGAHTEVEVCEKKYNSGDTINRTVYELKLKLKVYFDALSKRYTNHKNDSTHYEKEIRILHNLLNKVADMLIPSFQLWNPKIINSSSDSLKISLCDAVDKLAHPVIKNKMANIIGYYKRKPESHDYKIV